MMNMHTISKVFVDTNVFVTIRDTTDSTHGKALKLSEFLDKDKTKWYTSSDVVGETLTVLSKKLGKKIAQDWYKDYKDSNIKEIYIDGHLHVEARNYFFRVKSKNVSFVDCSSVVAMKNNKIQIAFSFDEDFRNMGVKLLGDVI